MNCLMALDATAGDMNATVEYLRKQEEAKKMNEINEMRVMKFEAMVRDIAKFGSESVFDNGFGIDNKNYLALIYDYDELNAYGKAVIEQGRGEGNVDDYWLLENFASLDKKRSRTREFIEKCNDDRDKGKIISLYYIFWAMMILTVDDTDKEEHLSLICDFARMLKISDEEMMDIVQVIQMIYNKAEDMIEFQTKLIPYNFDGLLRDIGYVSEETIIATTVSPGFLFGGPIETKKNINEVGEGIKRWEKKAH